MFVQPVQSFSSYVRLSQFSQHMILQVLHFPIAQPTAKTDAEDILHCKSKKQDTKLVPITSPNVNRFSKFFADSVNLQQSHI